MCLDAIDYSSSGDFFVTGGTDNVVKLWDDREMKLVSELSGEFTHTSGHSNRIFCTKFSPFS